MTSTALHPLAATLDLTRLTLVDPDATRADISTWLHTVWPSRVAPQVVAFHSNYGGEANGLFTIWAELYDSPQALEGDSIDHSEHEVAADVAADSATAWALCSLLRDTLNAAVPNSAALS